MIAEFSPFSCDGAYSDTFIDRKQNDQSLEFFVVTSFYNVHWEQKDVSFQESLDSWSILFVNDIQPWHISARKNSEEKSINGTCFIYSKYLTPITRQRSVYHKHWTRLISTLLFQAWSSFCLMASISDGDSETDLAALVICYLIWEYVQQQFSPVGQSGEVDLETFFSTCISNHAVSRRLV